MPSAVDALLGRLADLWRCGSAFRAEGWKVPEELEVEGGGELATLGGAVPGGLWLGAPLLTTAAYVASSCCRYY